MKVSDCCGVPAYSNGDSDTEDIGICPECKEHCEYVEEDDTEPNDKNIIGESVAIPLHREQGDWREDLQRLKDKHGWNEPSTPAGKEEEPKYNSLYPDAIQYTCDKNFIVRLKALFDRKLTEAGWTSRGKKLKEFIETLDSAEDYLFNTRTPIPPSPQSEQAAEKVFITGVREGFSGWQAWFKIDHQTFYLQPVTEINDVENTQERAKWYEQNLIIALTRLLTKH